MLLLLLDHYWDLPDAIEIICEIFFLMNSSDIDLFSVYKLILTSCIHLVSLEFFSAQIDTNLRQLWMAT